MALLTDWPIIVLSIISSFCCLIIIFVSLTESTLRRFPAPLILNRAICDLLFSLQFIVFLASDLFIGSPDDFSANGSPPSPTNSCRFNAFMAQFAQSGSMGWYFVFSLNFYLSITDPFKRPSKRFWNYSLFVWPIALLTATLASVKAQYRPVLHICWTQQVDGLNYVNWLVFFIWLFCYWGFSIIILVLAVIKLQSGGLNTTLASRKETLQQSFVFVIIFTLYWSGVASLYVASQLRNEQNSDLYESFAAALCSLGIVDFICWTYIYRQTLQIKILIWLGNFGDFIQNTFGNFNKNQNNKSLPNYYSNMMYQASSSSLRSSLLSLSNTPQEEIYEDISEVLREEFVRCTIDGVGESTRRGEREEMLEEEKREKEISGGGSGGDGMDEPQGGGFRSWSFQSNIPSSPSSPSSSSSSSSSSRSFFLSAKSTKKSSYKFIEYYPALFSRLRRIIFHLPHSLYLSSMGVNADDSIISSITQHFSEGASGSFFYLSYDKRFIVKTMTKSEHDFFCSILSPYFHHMMNSRDQSLIIRFFGLYSIKMYGNTQYFTVMENVLWTPSKINDGEEEDDEEDEEEDNHNYNGILNRHPKKSKKSHSSHPVLIHEKYDLKGSWINRNASRHSLNYSIGKTMKDNDLHRTILIDLPTAIAVLQRSIMDVIFFKSNNIMDYSLLLGIHHCKEVKKRIWKEESQGGNGQVGQGGEWEWDRHCAEFDKEDEEWVMRKRMVNKKKDQEREREREKEKEKSQSHQHHHHNDSHTDGKSHHNHTSDEDSKSLSSPPSSSASSSLTSKSVRFASSSLPTSSSQSSPSLLSSSSTSSLSPSPSTLYSSPSPSSSATPLSRPFFQSYHGGMAAAIIEGPGIYFLGIIDVLQTWNWEKKLEAFAKKYIRLLNPYGISARPPLPYAERFVLMVRHHLAIPLILMHNQLIGCSVYILDHRMRDGEGEKGGHQLLSEKLLSNHSVQGGASSMNIGGGEGDKGGQGGKHGHHRHGHDSHHRHHGGNHASRNHQGGHKGNKSKKSSSSSSHRAKSPIPDFQYNTSRREHRREYNDKQQQQQQLSAESNHHPTSSPLHVGSIPVRETLEKAAGKISNLFNWKGEKDKEKENKEDRPITPSSLSSTSSSYSAASFSPMASSSSSASTLSPSPLSAVSSAQNVFSSSPSPPLSVGSPLLSPTSPISPSSTISPSPSNHSNSSSSSTVSPSPSQFSPSPSPLSPLSPISPSPSPPLSPPAPPLRLHPRLLHLDIRRIQYLVCIDYCGLHLENWDSGEEIMWSGRKDLIIYYLNNHYEMQQMEEKEKMMAEEMNKMTKKHNDEKKNPNNVNSDNIHSTNQNPSLSPSAMARESLLRSDVLSDADFSEGPETDNDHDGENYVDENDNIDNESGRVNDNDNEYASDKKSHDDHDHNDRKTSSSLSSSSSPPAPSTPSPPADFGDHENEKNTPQPIHLETRKKKSMEKGKKSGSSRRKGELEERLLGRREEEEEDDDDDDIV